MRKKVSFKLGVILSVCLLSISCEEEPPQADFSATKEEINGSIYVTFNDESSNNPDSWNWTFDGGFPATSKEENPTILYKNSGKFFVRLEASNKGGGDKFYEDNFVNVASFSNETSTDAEITLGDEIFTVLANSTYKYVSFRSLKSNCHIETSGKNGNGEQVGILIYWDFDIDIDVYHAYLFSVSPELVFFKMTNNSDIEYNHFMVNCGNPDFESLEEISVPNDGIKQGIGYYVANTGMEVKAYSPEGYAMWKDGYSFSLPWKENLVVDLSSNNTINSKLQFSEKLKSKPQLKNEVEEGTKIITETGFK